MQYKIRQFYHFMQWSSETIFIKKTSHQILKKCSSPASSYESFILKRIELPLLGLGENQIYYVAFCYLYISFIAKDISALAPLQIN